MVSLRDVISAFFRGTMFSKNRWANNQNMPLFTIFLLQLFSVEKIRGGLKAKNVIFLPFFYNKFCLSKNQGGMAPASQMTSLVWLFCPSSLSKKKSQRLFVNLQRSKPEGLNFNNLIMYRPRRPNCSKSYCSRLGRYRFVRKC